jgi:hypothetical protein
MPKLISKTNEDFYTFTCNGVQRTYRSKKTLQKSLALHRKCCPQCDNSLNENKNTYEAEYVFIATIDGCNSPSTGVKLLKMPPNAKII